MTLQPESTELGISSTNSLVTYNSFELPGGWGLFYEVHNRRSSAHAWPLEFSPQGTTQFSDGRTSTVWHVVLFGRVLLVIERIRGKAHLFIDAEEDEDE